MRSKLILAGVLIAIVGGSLLARAFLNRGKSQAARGEGPYTRIVSTSPSTTEILFALGLGDRVVGVSRFCLYPPETQARMKVGGYLDPNFEAIIGLRPDLIVLRGENPDIVASFNRLGVKTLAVRHNSIDGIIQSIESIGDACDAGDEARKLTGELSQRIAAIEKRTAGKPRPRVLVVAERTLGAGKVENAFVAGGDGFINGVLRLAGGQNACPDGTAGYPVVSPEGILKMNPDVIVDLIAKRQQGGLSMQEILGDWETLPEVKAVRRGRVYLIDDDFAFVPGPRFVQLVEKLAAILEEAAP